MKDRCAHGCIGASRLGMLANGSSNQSAVRSKDALPIMDDTERIGPEEEGAKVGLEPIEDSLPSERLLGGVNGGG